MRYAIILANVVTNLVEWDGGPSWSPPSGTTAALAGNIVVSIGWLWNDGHPVDPNPPPTPPADPVAAARALDIRRAEELEKSPNMADQLAALKIRLKLVGG